MKSYLLKNKNKNKKKNRKWEKKIYLKKIPLLEILFKDSIEYFQKILKFLE